MEGNDIQASPLIVVPLVVGQIREFVEVQFFTRRMPARSIEDECDGAWADARHVKEQSGLPNSGGERMG